MTGKWCYVAYQAEEEEEEEDGDKEEEVMKEYDVGT